MGPWSVLVVRLLSCSSSGCIVGFVGLYMNCEGEDGSRNGYGDSMYVKDLRSRVRLTPPRNPPLLEVVFRL